MMRCARIDLGGMVVVMLFFLVASAEAALIDRGEGFIYDDVLDVTWTQDANINGRDTWDNQVAWAAGYSQTHTVYGTFDDWRLPTVTDTGTPGCNFAYTGTDCGYNVDTSTGEMASLFYDTLGGLASYDTSGNLWIPEKLEGGPAQHGPIHQHFSPTMASQYLLVRYGIPVRVGPKYRMGL